MRLGVVSDTHGQLESTRAAIHCLGALEVDEVLHCGDIETPDVIDLFAPWPTHFVFGNCDHSTVPLRTAIERHPEMRCHGLFGELERTDRTIAFLHSHQEHVLAEAVASGKYDLICHGHTHVAELNQLGDTWVLNPGALHRATKHTIAIVDLPELKVEHVTV